MAVVFRNRRLRVIVISLAVIVILYLLIYTKLPDGGRAKKDVEYTDTHQGKHKSTGPITKENLPERVTVIIREFEDFDNAITDSVEELERTLKHVKVLVISDDVPYPPVQLNPKGSARIVTLAGNLLDNHTSCCPLHQVDTDFVFVVPDNVKIRDWTFIKSAAAFLRSRRNTKAVAVPVSDSKLECFNMTVDYKRWTLSFPRQDAGSALSECQLIKGSHGLFLETETLRSLTEPLSRPFPFTYYVQARVKNWKTRVMKSGRLEVIRPLYTDPHSSWKRKRAITDRTKAFYRSVGIKREVLPTGASLYYGCDKDKPRCFGTVLKDMPQFLYQGRWTPPCCLRALRETANHVFRALEACGARYWLEGGSLLGAARHGDIIPWDYDVDVGMYKADIPKCSSLVKAQAEPFTDAQDFVWEKASEGDFFRVQYSEVNRLHVDIFPFYSKGGVMTKDSWFPTHRQDTEFPESFLTPLSVVEFAGVNASAPNNVKKFLEYKFGQGVVENPRYPNYQRPV
ncbi:fukutin-related protein [Aplysia californica]|uniref:Fukutin-related protein n=1 Tax=Aplysia californica TaxID=6500 RepID=A0ABM0JZ09_APLCA|nr:fukutin-related protein [Aplysia californica]XP_005104872.1 fukutin-related protein [Aplysia californica]